jgi:hypothetical protein
MIDMHLVDVSDSWLECRVIQVTAVCKSQESLYPYGPAIRLPDRPITILPAYLSGMYIAP